MSNQRKGVLGEKLGMTQVFDDEGRIVPVTVVQAGPCVVTQVRTPERDGYSAVQLGFGQINPRKVNKPRMGTFEKAGVTPRRHLVELRTDDAGGYELGQEITDPRIGASLVQQPGHQRHLLASILHPAGRHVRLLKDCHG